MKKRSGNGTSASQFLYLLIYLPIPLFVKVGISGNVWQRVGFISESLPGFVVPLLWVKVPFAWQLEQALHGWLSWLSVPFIGSGRTEYFWLPAVLIVAPIMLFLIVVKRLWLFLLALFLSWVLAGMPQEPVKAITRFLHHTIF